MTTPTELLPFEDLFPGSDDPDIEMSFHPHHDIAVCPRSITFEGETAPSRVLVRFPFLESWDEQKGSEHRPTRRLEG